MLRKRGRLWCELAANEQVCRRRRKSHYFHPNHWTALPALGCPKLPLLTRGFDQLLASPVLMCSQPMSPLTENMLTILSVAQMALPVERQEVPIEQKITTEEVIFLVVKRIVLLYAGPGGFFLVNWWLTRRFSYFKINWFYFSRTVCEVGVFEFRLLYLFGIHSLAFLPIRPSLKPNIQ